MACIYKITNKINGKVYIGQTIRSIEKRWYEHCSPLHPDSLVKRSILKHGVENFSIEVIFDTDDIGILDAKEAEFISLYNSVERGYNLKFGGTSARFSDASRDKMSKSALGRVVSEETKLKISKSSKGKSRKLSSEVEASKQSKLQIWRDENPDFHKKLGEINRQRLLGVKQSPEFAEKRRIAVVLAYKEKGEYSNTGAYVSVTQYSPDGKKLKVFESLDAAMKEFGLKSCTTIIAACTDPKRNHAAGFQWRYTDDNIDELPSVKIRGRQAVSATNLIDGTVYVFGSLSIARAFLSTKESNITRVCRKERKSSGGFAFEYL